MDQVLVVGDRGGIPMTKVVQSITPRCFCVEMGWTAGCHDSLEHRNCLWIDMRPEFWKNSGHITMPPKIFATKEAYGGR